MLPLIWAATATAVLATCHALANTYTFSPYTIKGGSRRAEKSRKVLLMMMMAAKLGLVEPGAGLEQSKSGAEA